RKKIQEEILAKDNLIQNLREEIQRLKESDDRKTSEIVQLTKAYETAVAAMDAAGSGLGGTNSVKTIYPSMLKRERASNKVLIQQLEEQGQKISELENKISQLESEREKQHQQQQHHHPISTSS